VDGEEDMELVLLTTSHFTESQYLVPAKISSPYKREDKELVELLSERLSNGVYKGKEKKNAFLFRQALCTQAHCNGQISNSLFQVYITGRFLNGDFNALTYSHAAVTILNHHIVALGYKRMHLGKSWTPWFEVDGKHPLEWYPLSLSKIPNEEQKALILKYLRKRLNVSNKR